MSAAASFLPRYTPAQLEADRRIKAIRAKQKAAMMARLREQQERERAEEEAQRAAEAERLAEARRQAAYREQMIQRRYEAAIILGAARAPESRGRGGLTVAASRFDDALARVSEAYGIPEDVIMSPARMVEITTARTHFMAILAKENPYASLPSLGRATGRDHTTVIHNLRCYNAATGENVRLLGSKVKGANRRRVLVFKPVRERTIAVVA